MKIRKYLPGEENVLYEIFYSAIHENAKGYYEEDQLDAWASGKIDELKWKNRIRGINPFIATENSIIFAYADLQDTGYIDHFFVKGGHSKKGIGTKLMKRIITEAEKKGIPELTSDVSLSAQPFFLKNGFEIVSRKKVMINGMELENALMRKIIK